MYEGKHQPRYSDHGISVWTIAVPSISAAILTLRCACLHSNKEMQTIFCRHIYVCFFIHANLIQLDKGRSSGSFVSFSGERVLQSLGLLLLSFALLFVFLLCNISYSKSPSCLPIGLGSYLTFPRDRRGRSRGSSVSFSEENETGDRAAVLSSALLFPNPSLPSLPSFLSFLSFPILHNPPATPLLLHACIVS